MAVIGTVTKQPNDIQDYDVDFSEWLARGDTVVSAVVFATPPMPAEPLMVISPNARTVKVWVYEGGAHGAKHKITVRASTTGGRVKEVELMVQIKEI